MVFVSVWVLWLSETAEGSEEFAVFVACAYGDAETVVAECDAAAIARDYAFVYEIVIDCVCICYSN